MKKFCKYTVSNLYMQKLENILSNQGFNTVSQQVDFYIPYNIYHFKEGHLQTTANKDIWV